MIYLFLMGTLCWVFVAAQTSLIVMWGLSCSAACGILVPQPGTKPMSPALQGGFFSTESPGKFWSYLLLDQPLNPSRSLQLLQLSWKCNYLKVQLLDRAGGGGEELGSPHGGLVSPPLRWKKLTVNTEEDPCVFQNQEGAWHLCAFGVWIGLPGIGISYVCLFSPSACPTLCDPMNCSLPGSSIHGIFQERILEWVAISSPRGSSSPRNQTHICYVSCIGRSSLPLVPPGKTHHSYWPLGYFTDGNPSSG